VSGVDYRASPSTGLEAYAVNNVQDGNPLYIGKVRSDGNWVIEKYDTTAGTLSYANFSNNAGTAGYGTAWTQRLSLVYGGFETLTGV
jgi:hypothetical protein